MGETEICSEIYGTRGKKRSYVTGSADSNQISIVNSNKNFVNSTNFTFTFSHAADIFKEAFLPQGYPDSVSDDYLYYQIWDSIQAFMSRLMSTLSTQAVLKGIGVGDEYSTPLAATITWLMRDGTSMLGRIVFTWYEGTSLDYNSKQWRLFADVMNDVAMCFDLLAAHVGALSTTVLCVAGVCRAMVEASGSATRAAFIQHQAKRDNLADVAAKDGSQETLVNLAGLISSLVLIRLVANSPTLVWTFYLFFTCLHLFANYKAVRAVSMNTFNQLRLAIVVRNFLRSAYKMPSINEVNLEEPVILGSASLKVYLGCSFSKTSAQVKPIGEILKLYQNSKYILTVNKSTEEIFVTLHKDSDRFTQLESCFQAHVILTRLNYAENLRQYKLFEEENLAKSENALNLLVWSRNFTARHFPTFLKIVQTHGWETNSNLLGAEEWRADWIS
ncbi:hypothetical protein CHUAL_005740 [Chamberlinius hualienensis]